MRSRFVAPLLAVLLVPTVVACKKDDAAKPADKKPADPKKTDDTKKAEPAPAPSPAKAEEMKPPAEPPQPAPDALVDYDLASRGKAWTGWTIKGPAGATIEADEGTFAGSTAIRWGNGMGAVGFKQGKLDFAYLEKEVFTVGQMTVTKKTADAIETTLVVAGTSLKCFYLNEKVGAADVGCWTVSCGMTDADVAQDRAICASLTKK